MTSAPPGCLPGPAALSRVQVTNVTTISLTQAFSESTQLPRMPWFHSLIGLKTKWLTPFTPQRRYSTNSLAFSQQAYREDVVSPELTMALLRWCEPTQLLWSRKHNLSQGHLVVVQHLFGTTFRINSVISLSGYDSDPTKLWAEGEECTWLKTSFSDLPHWKPTKIQSCFLQSIPDEKWNVFF